MLFLSGQRVWCLCSQVGFGRAFFDRWITVSGRLIVVRMIKGTFDEANDTEL